MYHHYTVDEHLLRCIGVLSEIERGDGEKIHPLSHTLMPGLKKSREAALRRGAAARHRQGPAGGPFGSRRQDRAAHLPAYGAVGRPTPRPSPGWSRTISLMSMTAQTRDLNDRKTIDDFASVVQSVERLKLLLVLTVCDIRGVGPGVWNGWKGQLLRTLYYETELLLTGGFSEVSRAERADRGARAACRGACRLAADERAATMSRLHYENYLLAVDLERPAAARRIHPRGGRRRSKQLATMVKTHEFEAVTEITVLAQDHPRLLSVIAGACAAAGGNIVDAQIFTTADGRALDTILISREFDRDEDERRRAERVGRLIEDVLSGKSWLPEMIEKRTKPKRGAKTFRIEPRADIRNTLSNRFSVIEVEGLDRPGLLSEITGALSDLSLDIASAHITTFGEKVIDTFYVTDLTGQKIENPTRQRNRPQKRLIAALEGACRDACRGARRRRNEVAADARRLEPHSAWRHLPRGSAMSLVRKFATVASGTLMSRVLGFAREMLMAAALGTGPVADAFNAAFQFPNTFRRLFAEGAFNAAFVPLFAKEIEANGIDGAKRFSEEVFGVLFTVLLALTILMELAMPLLVRDRGRAGLRRRSGEIRPDGGARHHHVPLPDLHVARRR